ncbi:MAG: phospholipid/cholesterol/gamma-HCH transport system substrate-binding protein [Thermoleophilaceae bacterium]|jgi:ABC-type transporter Mla subunit MlaD|nr:phospholipid/cholesterol/gamma-HCH transport system substrate-binding protein [Thermoleophilaceae bacterium]
MSRRQQHSLAGSPVLVGAATVLCAVVAVFLSYNANNGLPFVPIYDLTVQVHDAAGLVPGNEVRVGGKRVGVIEKIRAVPGRGDDPVSELEVALLTTLDPLPADSRVTVRPRSPLGLKYLELRLGDSAAGLAAGSTVPLRAAQPIVELDEVQNAFDSSSRRALRQVLDGVAPGFTGRGAAVNELLAEAPELLRRGERVAENVSAQPTRLRRLLVSADRLTGELAQAAVEAGSALDGADTTAGALDLSRAELDEVLTETPPTQAAAMSAFREARPLLTDAAALMRDIRPGVELLPRAAVELDRALDEGTPVLRRAVALAARLEDTLAAVAELSEDPATSSTLVRLLRVLVSAKPTVEFLVPAQTRCNHVGLWTRNVPSSISEGDESGTWFRTLVVADKFDEALASAEPAPDLHVNVYPHTGQNGECEVGNEPWLPGRQIGNVPGDQGGTTEPTRPPPGVGGR